MNYKYLINNKNLMVVLMQEYNDIKKLVLNMMDSIFIVIKKVKENDKNVVVDFVNSRRYFSYEKDASGKL